MELIRKIVIAGGDSVAAMVAATIAISLRGFGASVVLIDTQLEHQGAHSTLPQTNTFHGMLGINVVDLLKQTNATFKLGVDCTGWVQPGHHFVHGYGNHGVDFRLVPFHHYYIKKRLAGDLTTFSSYSLAAEAANKCRFDMPVKDESSILSSMAHGLHVDAAQYAMFFRELARRSGVTFVEGDVDGTSRRPGDGLIESIRLDDGSLVEGDLFIDCTGDRALLIGGAPGQDYVDWSSCLPCDRSIGLSVTGLPDTTPLTFAVAKEAGWLRRMTMRDRSDYEFFYNSRLLSDDKAEASLRHALGRKIVGEPRTGKFINGYRKIPWQGNCVAIGRSAGFIEPLQSSNLRLAQNAVLRLMRLFPSRACETALATEYMRIQKLEYENVRDMVSLFFASSKRTGSAFWNHCQTLEIPDSLAYKIKLFESRGRLAWYEEETFPMEYWISALLGLDRFPRGYDPLADVPNEAFVNMSFDKMHLSIQEAVQKMPTHEAFIANMLSA